MSTPSTALGDLVVQFCDALVTTDQRDPTEYGKLFADSPVNMLEGGGRFGQTRYELPGDDPPWDYLVVLPNDPKKHADVHFVAMQTADSNDHVAVFIGYIDGRLATGWWDGDNTGYTNKSFGCLKRLDSAWGPQVSYINTAFPAARISGTPRRAGTVPPDAPGGNAPSENQNNSNGNNPPGSVPGQPPVAGQPPTFDGSGDLPGTFGAGIQGLPSKPGWFKTPGGFCRAWEPWERAILKLAQDKNKKDMEAYLESVNCRKPQRACKFTSCY